MPVTIESVLDSETTERFRAVYRSGFGPLEPLAAARQSLTDDEFRAEMTDPTVLKFLGSNSAGEPVALLTASDDLDHVAWISPSFYATRYPDHAARNAIVYVGCLVVHPDVKGGPWMRRLTTEISRYCAERSAIMAFDCCQHNIDGDFPKHVATIASSVAHVEPEMIDVQQYYAYVFSGLRDDAHPRWTRSRVPDSDTNTPERQAEEAQ